MKKARVEAEVKGLGSVLVVEAPFDEALSALRSDGVRYPISTRDLAKARIKKGKQSSLFRYGSYTREGFAYAKGEQGLLVLNSPLLKKQLAKQVVEENRKASYFSTSDLQLYEELAEKGEQDKNKEPEKRRVLILPKRDIFQIACQDDIARGLFKDQAETYFDFIGQDKISVYPVSSDTIDSQYGTLLTQLWFDGLDYRSELYGNSWDLYCSNVVRGVCESAEGTAKNVGIYTEQDITLAEKELGRLAKILQPEQLTKLNSLIGKLRGK